jgi:hypothetical protein
MTDRPILFVSDLTTATAALEASLKALLMSKLTDDDALPSMIEAIRYLLIGKGHGPDRVAEALMESGAQGFVTAYGNDGAIQALRRLLETLEAKGATN